jgi:hypothetical protein
MNISKSKILKLALSIGLTCLASQAAFEETTISNPGDTKTARGNTIVENELVLFGNNGLTFIPPTGTLATSNRLTTNASGDLLYRSFPLINNTGSVNANSANFSGNVTAPTFIGNLKGNATSATETLGINGTVDANNATGILAVANGGSGTNTATGTAGSVVLNNSPSFTGTVTINGTINLGQSNICDSSEAGQISYDPATCRTRLCDGSEFINPSGGAFEDKFVFVTEGRYLQNLVQEANNRGAGVTNGIEAADFLCNQSADSSGLKGTYKAIISGVGKSGQIINAIDRLPANTSLKLTDGSSVNFCNLWDGNIDTGINLNESANAPSQPPIDAVTIVWTGTNPDGTLEGNFTNPIGNGITDPINHSTCNNWEGTNGQPRGVVYGIFGQTDDNWIDINPIVDCDFLSGRNRQGRLYCVQQ